MKQIYLLVFTAIFSCNQSNNQLSVEEIEQVKMDIIELSEKHASAIENLEYEKVMKFYADVDDFVMYGDGFYWGDYLTLDGIWKDFLNPKNWKGDFIWDLSNHKIHVFSKDAASLLVEFDHERTTAIGETTKGHGCFSYGLKRIEGDWKIVTVHVTHNYNVFDEKGNVRKWWSGYSPENRINE